MSANPADDDRDVIGQLSILRLEKLHERGCRARWIREHRGHIVELCVAEQPVARHEQDTTRCCLKASWFGPAATEPRLPHLIAGQLLAAMLGKQPRFAIAA